MKSDSITCINDAVYTLGESTSLGVLSPVSYMLIPFLVVFIIVGAVLVFKKSKNYLHLFFWPTLAMLIGLAIISTVSPAPQGKLIYQYIQTNCNFAIESVGVNLIPFDIMGDMADDLVFKGDTPTLILFVAGCIAVWTVSIMLALITNRWFKRLGAMVLWLAVILFFQSYLGGRGIYQYINASVDSAMIYGTFILAGFLSIKFSESRWLIAKLLGKEMVVTEIALDLEGQSLIEKLEELETSSYDIEDLSFDDEEIEEKIVEDKIVVELNEEVIDEKEVEKDSEITEDDNHGALGED